jgi:hypothetical protein
LKILIGNAIIYDITELEHSEIDWKYYSILEVGTKFRLVISLRPCPLYPRG